MCVVPRMVNGSLFYLSVLFVRHRFHDILNPAVKDDTQPVENGGLYDHIMAQPVQLRIINPMLKFILQTMTSVYNPILCM